jgi:hypothetical protein
MRQKAWSALEEEEPPTFTRACFLEESQNAYDQPDYYNPGLNLNEK